MATETLSIGELARTTGTKVETIRYYERIGLLPAPARTGGNYRAYARQLIDQCKHTTAAECRIIEALAPGA